MRFLLDTNFIIEVVKKSVDMSGFMEFGLPEFYILEGSIKELERLAQNKGKKGVYAKVAIELIEWNKFNILKSEEKSVDTDLSKRNGFVVCTQDRELRKRLTIKGFRTIYLRHGKVPSME